MALLRTALVLIGLGLTAGAAAQSPAPADRDVALGRLLDQFATVAGGWFLDQRCNHLSPELKREFEWNVAQTNLGLARHVGMEVLITIQQGARGAANAEVCGSKTEELVSGTLAMSRETAFALTGQRFSRATEIERDAERVAMLFLAQKLDDQCKLMPQEIRQEFDSRIADIVGALQNDVGRPVIDAANAIAARGLARAGSRCDAPIEQFLKGGVAEARQMSPAWRPK